RPGNRRRADSARPHRHAAHRELPDLRVTMDGIMAAYSWTWVADNLPFITIFISTVLAVFGANALIGAWTAVRHRLGVAGEGPIAAGGASIRYQSHGAFHRLVVEPLRDKLVPADIGEASARRLALIQAGFMGPHALAAYYAVRFIAALVLPG